MYSEAHRPNLNIGKNKNTKIQRLNLYFNGKKVGNILEIVSTKEAQVLDNLEKSWEN